MSPDDAAIEREFNLVRAELKFPENFNVAPTQAVPAVRSIEGVRKVSLMRWGLIPFFARGVPGAYSTINARVETLETAASYRGPWKSGQRCIVPVSGFYDWHVNDDGKKQPFYVTCAGREVYGLAGLWDSSARGDGTSVESCTIITMAANSLMAGIHNAAGKQRMPVILRREDYDAWLAGSIDDARAVIKEYPSESMVAWPVSARVNTAKNNDAKLIAPVAWTDMPRAAP